MQETSEKYEQLTFLEPICGVQGFPAKMEEKEMTCKELKPCPFCGGENLEILGGDDIDKLTLISCDNCGATVAFEKKKISAINAWNRRANNDKQSRNKIQRVSQR